MNHSLYRFLNVETGLDHQIFVWLDLWLAWPEQWLDLWLAWFSPQWLGTCLRLEGYDLRLACDLHMNDLPPPLPTTSVRQNSFIESHYTWHPHYCSQLYLFSYCCYWYCYCYYCDLHMIIALLLLKINVGLIIIHCSIPVHRPD